MSQLPTARPDVPFIAPGTGIPRVLNQIFLAGWDAVPDELRDGSVPALRARNPEWQYRFFDATAATEFIGRVYGPEMLRLYQSIDPAYYAARGDLLRYLVIYAEGGVYLDMKSDIVMPLDSLLRPDDACLLSQWPSDPGHRYGAAGRHPELSHVPGGEYQQWFVIAAPGHPFLRAVIERVVGNLTSYSAFRDGVGATGVLNATGPIAYTLAINPILGDHPHRMIRSLDEGVMRYSVFPDRMGHKDTGHYAYVTRPIVPRHPASDFAAKAVFAARRKLHRLSVRVQGSVAQSRGAEH